MQKWLSRDELHNKLHLFGLLIWQNAQHYKRIVMFVDDGVCMSFRASSVVRFFYDFSFAVTREVCFARKYVLNFAVCVVLVQTTELPLSV